MKCLRKPKRGPTAKKRASKRAKQQRADRAVYAAVDKRDGQKSRLNGMWYGDHIERHHIIPRSLGGPTTTENVISLAPLEHRAIHDGKLKLSGNADVIGWVDVWRCLGLPGTLSAQWVKGTPI